MLDAPVLLVGSVTLDGPAMLDVPVALAWAARAAESSVAAVLLAPCAEVPQPVSAVASSAGAMMAAHALLSGRGGGIVRVCAELIMVR